MKIERLELRAFGPFTGALLDLSGGAHGLHVVFGLNEAGKSSALRAVKQLLYGIPHASSDNFLHANDKLRIAATIQAGGGKSLEIVRRKGRKQDLRCADDDTPIAPALLERALSHLSQADFETMFGIDHATLVAGGRAIVAGGGELGGTLFGAGAGIANLRQIQDALKADAEELFKPSGSKPKINERISDFEKARKEIREAQLPSAVWEAHDKSLKQAVAALQEVKLTLQSAHHEQTRLHRLQEAVPLVARRNDLRRRLDAGGPVQLLADDFPVRRAEISQKLALRQADVRRAAATLGELAAQASGLHAPRELLDQGPAIQALETELGAYLAAQRDLPGLASKHREAMAEARLLLRQYRPDLDVSEAAQLALSRHQEIELNNLANQHGAAETGLAEAERELEEVAEQIAALGQPTAADGPVADVAPLESAVRRVQQAGRPEEALANRFLAWTRQKAEVDAALKRLPLWTGSLESLEQLAAPGATTIDRFERDVQELTLQQKSLADPIRQLETRKADLQQQFDEQQLRGAAPSEADLSAARRERDETWLRVREAWRAGPLTGQTNLDMATAHEAQTREADQVADRLRHEADRVASQARNQAERATCDQQASQYQARLADLRQSQERLQEEWLAIWSPLGIAPLSPREMRVWEQQRVQLLQQAAQLGLVRMDIEQLERQIEQARSELDGALRETGQAPGQVGETLAAQLDRADRIAAQLQAEAAERQSRQKELARLRRAQEGWRQRAIERREQLDAWRHAWVKAIAPLGLPQGATTRQANEALAHVKSLLEKVHEADGFAERIAEINHYGEQFGAAVAALRGSLGLEATEAPPAQAAQELISGYRSAAQAQSKLDDMAKQRLKREAELDKARQEQFQCEELLAQLCREAGCTDAERLPDLERRSREASDLRQHIEAIQQRLVEIAAPAPLEAFLTELENVDVDALPGLVKQQAEVVADCQHQMEELNKTIGGEEKELKAMDASAQAAEAGQRAQGLLAEIHSHAEHYVRLRLAQAVLREAVERYRDKNQGPLLTRASELFAELTAGSFSGLRADYNDKGEPILVGVRGGPRNADTVRVEGMSEGAADQLYLALRLAGLELYLTEKEPIPFIVDDILIKFDNQRSLAALRVLARLSQQTQVIFFTHHEHLVEMARRRLDPAVLFVHSLEQGHDGNPQGAA